MGRMIALLAALFALSGWIAPAAAQSGARTLILVARPGMPDRNFRETVILVTQGADGQSVGVILNRPTDHSLASILPGSRFRHFTDPVYFGGPVAAFGLFAVFRGREKLPGAIPVMPGVYLALEESILEKLLQSPPSSMRLYAGYAGWGPGQLRAELDRGDWYALKADADLVFSKDTAGLWDRLLRQARSVAAMSGAPAPPL